VRVYFDVHGDNEADLYDKAKAQLAKFSEGRRWNIDIEAHPESYTIDEVILWRGEVEASHEDLET